jgi:hypothetical protein
MRARRLLSLVFCLGACAGDEPGLQPVDAVEDLAGRARSNLARIAAELDGTHLANYGLAGEVDEQFFAALEIEYAGGELEARVWALASMVFLAAPDLLPPEGGRSTPFHGLDLDQLDDLVAIEEQILAGEVRPLSVCETTYLIETYVRPRRPFGSMDGYAGFAAGCSAADLAEWYSFRGIGRLTPSWGESTVMDRLLRRMASRCQGPDPGWEDECAEWDADRLGYRLERNRQMAARFLHHDPASQGALLADTSQEVVLFEDRSGDGIAEILVDGPARLMSGEAIDFEIMSTGEFTGLMKARVEDSMISVRAENLFPDSAARAGISRELVARADMGLADCSGECSLVELLAVLVDRHLDSSRTYSALQPDSASISSQPSPLVGAALVPPVEAGFVLVTRAPFDDILAGDALANLDVDRVWFDLATLSSRGVHEVARLGAVPAAEIEGILVLGQPD